MRRQKDGDSKETIEPKATIPCSLQVALQGSVIANLFRHHVDFLAPLYDLNDSQNLFGTLVPMRALSNPVLFKALVAFLACHQNRLSGRLQGLGSVYHATCVRELLAAVDDFQSELQGDYLAATCLLRSYEILNDIHQFPIVGE
jgi:hypothetical protein